MESFRHNLQPVTRVLLIDDDVADLELAKLALAKCSLSNYNVKTARRLEQGKQLLQENEFDVILLDLGLPESKGMETLDEINKFTEQVPIIVLTDLVDDEAAFGSLFRGAQDFLPKAELGVGSLSRSIQYSIQRHQLHQQLTEANVQLQEKNEQLTQLCETAQRFVDNVSHEFRTPLTVIKEYVSLLREGVVGTSELDSEQCQFLEIVADRADDLNTMVDDMLDVSKLESGLLGCWRKSCDVESVINHVLPAMERKAAVKNVKLTVSIQDNLGQIFCDAEKIGRVLINLVINAIKFCGQPGRVEICAASSEDGRDVVFNIIDNGPGIDPEELALIFQRFKQLGTVARGTSKGFGLGLNIARELVNLNFGEMNVSSQLGKGSSFSFSVPVYEPVEIISRFITRLQSQGTSEISAVDVNMDSPDAEFLADDVDAVLHFMDLENCLIIRRDPRNWLMVFAGPLTNDLSEKINSTIRSTNRNRPHEPLPELELLKLGGFTSGSNWRPTIQEFFEMNAHAVT